MWNETCEIGVSKFLNGKWASYIKKEDKEVLIWCFDWIWKFLICESKLTHNQNEKDFYSFLYLLRTMNLLVIIKMKLRKWY